MLGKEATLKEKIRYYLTKVSHVSSNSQPEWILTFKDLDSVSQKDENGFFSIEKSADTIALKDYTVSMDEGMGKEFVEECSVFLKKYGLVVSKVLEEIFIHDQKIRSEPQEKDLSKVVLSHFAVLNEFLDKYLTEEQLKDANLSDVDKAITALSQFAFFRKGNALAIKLHDSEEGVSKDEMLKLMKKAKTAMTFGEFTFYVFGPKPMGAMEFINSNQDCAKICLDCAVEIAGEPKPGQTYSRLVRKNSESNSPHSSPRIPS